MCYTRFGLFVFPFNETRDGTQDKSGIFLTDYNLVKSLSLNSMTHVTKFRIRVDLCGVSECLLLQIRPVTIR